MKKIHLLTMFFLIFSLTTCQLKEITEITFPGSGAIFMEGEVINVTADAQDPDGIKAVSLWINNVYHSIDNEEPYLFTVSDLTAGSYTFMIKAEDSIENINESPNVTIIIKDPDDEDSNGKFIVTSVNDDLDNSDAQDFIDGFIQLGYNLDQWDKNISKSELKSYLGKEQEFLYHTGHGMIGKIMTSDGELTADDLTVQMKATIVATCLTLNETKWKQTFGPKAQIIMGYTKVSWDKPTDNDLIKSFLEKYSNGNSYLEAWYKSNIEFSSLNDRWLAYTREGSSIVEYSARSNNIPPNINDGITVVLNDRVTVNSNLLDDSSMFDPGFQVALVEETSSLLTMNGLVKNSWPTTSTSLAPAEAKKIAENELAIHGGKPDTAILDRVIPIQKCDEFESCFKVAYQVNFVQQYDGRNLRSNAGTDYIALLINDNGLVSLDSLWSRVTPTDETISSQDLIDPGTALLLAVDRITQLVRYNPINIVSYERVDGVLTREDGTKVLVPAYEFFGETGERFIVSAVDGELVF